MEPTVAMKTHILLPDEEELWRVSCAGALGAGMHGNTLCAIR
jgi:hypothetical protein